MTLIAVEASPTLRLVSKAAEVDPGGTHELLRFALYETLCDQVDAARPFLERDLDEFVTKRDDALRRAQVRAFIDARIAGEDVSAISKAAPATDNDRKHGWFRDVLGRFATHASNVGQGADSARGALEAAGREGLRDDPFDKPRYAGMRATGAALSTLNSNNANLVGAAASAVGSLGPEAEKVLGNGLRRTAYRYRGTEKLPDKRLKKDIESGLAAIGGGEAAAAVLRGDADAEIRGRALAGRPSDKDRSSVRAAAGVSPSVAVAQYYGSRRNQLTDDQLEMRVAGDLAANYYLNKLPSPEQTAISIAAGAVPPSQGVIIDDEGDVVSEAMGFNGDHYVPFDLKNLRSLHGGQYVRTRAVGGPTTEDIYTGLLSGARQVQVVSSSGVFTLEFDPSVRGGRRYSDKARQMVTRYQRILDAIDQSDKSDLYQVDITPGEKREIQQRLSERYTGDDLKTVVDHEIKTLRERKSFKMLTDEEIEREARSRLRTTDNRGELKNLIAEVKEENRLESVKRFQLDGDGYEAAMKALQQEFPYFVRAVKRERLPDFVESRGLKANVKFSGATDQGYVSPATAVTGRARSVSNKQRAYDSPQRGRGAAPDTDESTGGGEGATDAQTGAHAAAHAGTDRGFHAVRNDAKAQRLTKLAGQRLSEAAGQLIYPDQHGKKVVEPGFGMDIQGDGEFKGLSPAVALFAVHERANEHPAGLLDYLATKAGPNERAAYLRALDKAEDTADRYGIEDPEGIGDAAASVAAVVRLLQPFGDGNDMFTYRPDENHGLPIKITKIEQLGLDPAAYAAFESEHLKNRGLMNQIEAYDETEDLPAMSAMADSDIAAAQREVEQASEGTPEHDMAVNQLKIAQQAFAYSHTKRLAQDYYRATNQDWDEVGKALAGPESASRPSRKAPVRWHGPGSPLATEFQKFLASR